ncbi:hypothetical protein EJD97_019976 [Solanum chilense]|uniref:DUF7780 domain-containing protein n=1 Tax=Solanum chilense TaxID=4083 RepID=A0A6N2AYW2_SOLCI|nr:hypothetical protein EJD97_019976 [Solanum chilense]
MGTLSGKGTRFMSDLIVAHVIESLTVQELKLFTKLISGPKSAQNSTFCSFSRKDPFFFKTLLLKKTLCF